MDNAVPGRAQSYKVLSEEQPIWYCALRGILDSSAPQTEPPTKKRTSFKEVDFYAAVNASEVSRGFEELPRPRQEAANLFPEAFPPYVPFSTPELPEAL